MLDWLGDLGGVFNALKILGAIFLMPFEDNVYQNAIFNDTQSQKVDFDQA